MSKKTESPVNHVLTDVRLGVKLQSIITPVDSPEFISILEKSGYSEIEQAANIPSNYRAKKGSIRFYLDDVKLVFGFHGNSVDSVVTAMNDLQGAIKKQWRVDIKSYVWFYEIETLSAYHSEHNVYEVLSKVYQDSRFMGDFEKMVGEKLAQLTIRLFPRNKESNRPDWFEIVLEPRITSGGKTYHARVLYRNKDLVDVARFGKKASDVIEGIVNTIER